MSIQIASLESNIKQPLYEPKRNNRFIVTFPEEFGIKNFVVKSLNRPTCHILEDYSISWNNISFVFYDPISPSTTQVLMENVRTKKIFQTINVLLEILDPVGIVVEKWNIKGKFKYFNFGELDYENDGLITILADFEVLEVDNIF